MQIGFKSTQNSMNSKKYVGSKQTGFQTPALNNMTLKEDGFLKQTEIKPAQNNMSFKMHIPVGDPKEGPNFAANEADRMKNKKEPRTALYTVKKGNNPDDYDMFMLSKSDLTNFIQGFDSYRKIIPNIDKFYVFEVKNPDDERQEFSKKGVDEAFEKLNQLKLEGKDKVPTVGVMELNYGPPTQLSGIELNKAIYRDEMPDILTISLVDLDCMNSQTDLTRQMIENFMEVNSRKERTFYEPFMM